MRGLFGVAETSSRFLTRAEIDHVYHCFDYLRQVIICLADPTMDPFHPTSETPGVIETLGWGNTHVCRDWEALSDWADEHTFANKTSSNSWRKDGVIF